MEILLAWLVKQGAVVVISGVIIWWLQDRLKKTEESKETLTREVHEVMKLWEAQGKNLKEDSTEDIKVKNDIATKLAEIKTLLESVIYKDKLR